MSHILEDCPICDLGQQDVGYINSRGSTIVHKTGNNPSIDWFVVLQPTTAADPKTGMNYQIMPVGHLEHISDMKTPEICSNFGIITGITGVVMEQILREEYQNSDYQHSEIYVAKSGTPENSLSHLHFKTLPFSGPAAQPFPTDAGWTKKEPVEIGGMELVCGSKVEKTKLLDDRLDYLRAKSIYKFIEVAKQYK